MKKNYEPVTITLIVTNLSEILTATSGVSKDPTDEFFWDKWI